MSWIVIRSPASVVAISSSSIDWPQIPFFRPSFFSIAHASAFARARRERVVRTERRRRRSASLPCLSLLSPRDAIRIPIPSGPRCLRASALGPAVPLSVRPSVRRGLPVAVCRPPCCRHSLDGPIRVRWPRCPRPRAADAVACGVPLLPSVPPPPPRLTRRLRRYRALRTKALQTSGSRSLGRNAIYVHEGKLAFRENNPRCRSLSPG